MWSGLMIFSSTEANDMVSVEVLTVLVVLMTVVMMVWLIAQLARECGHEKAASVVEMQQKFVALRRRVSRFRMSPEARQRDIRRRTFDANDSMTSVNPVTIEMAGIYRRELVATGGEIKVDDDVVDVDGGALFAAELGGQGGVESVNVKEKGGLRFKNPLKRNKKAGL